MMNHAQIQLGLFNEKTPPLIIQKGDQLAKCGVRKQHEKRKQKKKKPPTWTQSNLSEV